MDEREVTRRDLLRGGAALAGLAALGAPLAALATPLAPGDEVVPWADQPPPNPVPQVVGSQLAVVSMVLAAHAAVHRRAR